MSSVFEELLTSTIGFIIAMVIMSAVIAGGLYGYWVYANHVTLENYLWPIAEVLPYKGSYFLAIVNTGYEPFYVEQIYLKGGAVITPGQAANPGLGWCSVSNTKLMHNQWWCGMVNQLPVAVRVCSAIDPKVCIVAPVHGWSVVTFSQATFGVGSGLIEVVVNDPYNAGWSVSWSYSGQSYSLSKSTSYTWYINPPYIPIQISFKASITQNPTGYKCQISPASVTATYSGGSVQEFTVTCTPAADIVIEDYYYGSFNQYGYYVCGDPVKYTINYWGNATGTLSGQVPCLGVNGQYNITYVIPTNGTVYWKLTSVSIPSGTTCTIFPTSGSVNPGQVATITFSCLYWPYNNNNGNNPPSGGSNNPPPSNNNACPVEPPSVSSSPSGAPQPTSSANVSSIPAGQSEPVAFTYNAPLSGNNYVFQYWVIGGSKYTSNVVTITETLTCTTPGQTLTGPSGTAYYQYQPPGTISIDPDTIDLTKTSETYKFTWTSAWSGTGIFTYSFSGSATITYTGITSNTISWSASVTLPGNTVAASGSGNLNVTSYPTPPNQNYIIVCTVSGSGTINGVSAGAGIEYGTASITCYLQSKPIGS
ncbi:MAG: hypothetical protein L7H05_03350 [Vulcanisaeta sp.]|nr:hypothetical protein [Vulcanisaeta sp.]